MNDAHARLHRLLRAARGEDAAAPAAAPFGFATRVVARWRDGPSRMGDAPELLRLVRRVTVGAAIIAVLATGGAYWQFEEQSDLGEAYSDVYAFADTAIETGLGE
ncbi:hypothetical protein BH20VER2_BH20VER2_09960 [soil metagenome]|nr:hypothetical protein [Chthoniobacterales bacterium]